MNVSRQVFETLVEKAIAGLPNTFAEHLQDLVVDVEDLPDETICQQLEIEDPHELLGLYHGVPLTERSVEMSGCLPDRITIYQKSVERACRTRDELVEQIRITTLHEIGHYLGLDEDDLDEVGFG